MNIQARYCKKNAGEMIDSGADIVSCQHSHCIGTTEKYNIKILVYGQGNTLFGYRKNNKSWNEGLLLQIILSRRSIEICRINFHTCLCKPNRYRIDGGEKAAERIKEIFN